MEFITNFDHSLASQNLDFVPPAWLDHLLRNATYLGDSRLMIILIPLLGMYLQRIKGWRTALILVIGASSACFSCEAVKHMVNRSRPEVSQMRLDGIKVPTSPSFPSGHTFSASALYPGIALIMVRFSSSMPLKIALPLLGTVLAFLVGYTRIYLGVHFFSDVVAGLVGGLTFALAMAFLIPKPVDTKTDEASSLLT
ncbi:MAG: phosphatase PAP2 family protein [Planctomycetota bacterium]